MEFALSTIRQDSNQLNAKFFSQENINHLQKELQSRVYSQTKRLIDRQKDDDLFIIMRGVFVISATNPQDQVEQQVKRLNEMVLSHIVPQVVFGIKAHSKFLQDVEKPAEPIDRGMYVSMKGEKNNALPVGF